MKDDVFGLSTEEKRHYQHILTYGPLSLEELTERFGIDARHTVQRLRERGLLREGDHLTAIRPSLVLQGRLLEQRQSLAAAELQLSKLDEIYETSSHRHVIINPVEVIADEAQLVVTFGKIYELAQREIRHLITAPFVFTTGPDSIDRALCGNRRCRIIAEERVFDDPGIKKELVTSHQKGCEIRMANRLPHKLLIGDRRMALVPYLPGGGQTSALVVQAGTLLDSLVAMFEAEWDRALPLTSPWRDVPETQDRLSKEQVTILRLMVRGVTDATIAKGLGVSERTVTRRIETLQKRAGVRNRFQLGWFAQREGWIPSFLN